MILLIIYLIGVVTTLIFVPWAILKNNDAFYGTDLVITIFAAIFSWIGSLAFMVALGDELIIYKRKDR